MSIFDEVLTLNEAAWLWRHKLGTNPSNLLRQQILRDHKLNSDEFSKALGPRGELKIKKSAMVRVYGEMTK